MFAKTLKWPVISLLIVGSVHLLLEMVLPDLKTIFVPTVVAPVLLAFGLWVGYSMVQGGGNFGHAVVAAVLLGLLPIALDIVGFGIILGRGVQPGLLNGLFGFSMILWGALISGGFALSLRPQTQAETGGDRSLAPTDRTMRVGQG
jgi:hypothetical protein